MKLIEVRATAFRLPGNLPRLGDRAGVDAAPTQALTVVHSTPRPDKSTFLPGQQSAPFIAQLIAMKTGEAQTRERRRADPAEAMEAYRRALPRTAQAGTKTRSQI